MNEHDLMVNIIQELTDGLEKMHGVNVDSVGINSMFNVVGNIVFNVFYASAGEPKFKDQLISMKMDALRFINNKFDFAINDMCKNQLN